MRLVADARFIENTPFIHSHARRYTTLLAAIFRQAAIEAIDRTFGSTSGGGPIVTVRNRPRKDDAGLILICTIVMVAADADGRYTEADSSYSDCNRGSRSCSRSHLSRNPSRAQNAGCGRKPRHDRRDGQGQSPSDYVSAPPKLPIWAPPPKPPPCPPPPPPPRANASAVSPPVRAAAVARRS